jgi:hypothetical protein
VDPRLNPETLVGRAGEFDGLSLLPLDRVLAAGP